MRGIDASGRGGDANGGRRPRLRQNLRGERREHLTRQLRPSRQQDGANPCRQRVPAVATSEPTP